MKSCIYEGRLHHRRLAPVENKFSYSLFMMFIDLDELPVLFRNRLFWSTQRPAVAWFRRSDYLGDPNVPLDQAVRDRVERDSGVRPAGPIRILTHLRYFGHCFNPISFYYCYDTADQRVQTIVAEITNTPWKERHAYVLDETSNLANKANKRFRFGKGFHVSPFMDMDLAYDWRFSEPADRLTVHMMNLEQGSRIFDATLALQRKEITTVALTRCLLRYPLMTGKVVAAIHLQALRLWLKKCPFYAHPAKRNGAKEESSHA